LLISWAAALASLAAARFHHALHRFAVAGVHVERGRVAREKRLATGKSQRLQQGGIDVDDLAGGRVAIDPDRHVVHEAAIALFGGHGLGPLALGLAQEPGAAQQQGHLLADRLQRGDLLRLEPLGPLPPHEVEGAGDDAFDVHGHDHAGAVREAVKQLEGEPGIVLHVVAAGDGRLGEDAVAKALRVDRQQGGGQHGEHVLGHAIGGDGGQDPPIAIEQIHGGRLGTDEVRHLTGHPAERLGEVRLRGENARDRDERRRPVHVRRLAGDAVSVPRARAESRRAGRRVLPAEARGSRSGGLGGAGDGPARAGLVMPDRSELHVVAVLANTLLALGTGAHQDTPFRRGGSVNAVL
jgi:hypothetical protein